MMQPRKPKGAPNGTGGQYTTHPTGPTGLPHLDQYTGNGPQVDDRTLERTALYHPDSLTRGRAWHERITLGAVSPTMLSDGQRHDLTRHLAHQYGDTPHELHTQLHALGCARTYRQMVAEHQLPPITPLPDTPQPPAMDVCSHRFTDPQVQDMMRMVEQAIMRGHRCDVAHMARTNPYATVRGRACRDMIAHGELDTHGLTRLQQHDVALNLYDQLAVLDPDGFARSLEHTNTVGAFQHMLDMGEVMDPTSARHTVDQPTALMILAMCAGDTRLATRAARVLTKHPDPHVQTQARLLAHTTMDR